MSNIKYASLPGPEWLGEILVALGPNGIAVVTMGDPEYDFLSYVERLTGGEVHRDPAALRPTLDRFQAYLDGDFSAIDLPVDWSLMTPFQRVEKKASHASEPCSCMRDISRATDSRAMV